MVFTETIRQRKQYLSLLMSELESRNSSSKMILISRSKKIQDFELRLLAGYQPGYEFIRLRYHHFITCGA